MKTDDLITLLAQDAPVRWKLRTVLGLAFAGGVVAAGLLFVAGIGPRADIATAMGSMRFLFKFVVTLALAVTAGGLVLRLARPATPLGPWGWALALAPLLLLGAVVAEMLAMPSATWGARLMGHNARFCLTLIPLLAVGPLACLLAALRRGAPEHPGLAGAVAGLAAGGIAATFYAANCTDDSPFFVAMWYPVAIGMVTLAGAVIGSRLLRW